MLANLDPLQVWMLLYLPLAVIFYTIKHICKASAHWYRGGTTPTWCSGCDMLQPTASMRFTEIGLYRCGVCREPEKVIADKRQIPQKRLSHAAQIMKDHDNGRCQEKWTECFICETVRAPKHSSDIADNLNCTCIECRMPEDRHAMRELARAHNGWQCSNCNHKASHYQYGKRWCDRCMQARLTILTWQF